MMSYRATSWLIMAVYLIALGMVFWPLYARGHETMGHRTQSGVAEYLYGKQIQDTTDGKVNCCKYRGDGVEGNDGDGDCRELKEEDVKIVPNGFVWEGEFIPFSRSTISPPNADGEYKFYACRHAPNIGWGPNPRTHCFFYPPNGS
jgi:hypothetical protein